MTFENPTPLRIGMSGTFGGIRYAVKGRTVMSVNDAGSTYYWNEFYLVADDGRCATLVFEQTERGDEWRLFRLIEPERPISVEEASSRRVGDRVDITGAPLRVTLVDESRICHIEGEAPEGEDVGDVAHYFNAEGGNEMVVVSWTGNEVEVYRGITLPSSAVPAAFGLPPSQDRFHLRPMPAAKRSKVAIPQLVFAILIIASVVMALLLVRSGHGVRRSNEPMLSPAPLRLGDAPEIAGRSFRVTAHWSVEIGSVGSRFRRHEYLLADGSGGTALLISGSANGKTDWLLCEPLQPEQGLTPVQAGAKRQGDWVQIDPQMARIVLLFRSTVLSADGAEAGTLHAGAALYGFLAQGQGQKSDQNFMARWSEREVWIYSVKKVPKPKVKS